MEEDEDAIQKEKKDVNDLSEYNLDGYDEENSQPAGALGAFSNIKGLTYYKSNDEDPYITLDDDAKKEDEKEEREELEILPSDNLLVAAKTEEEISQLEVYVYDDKEENLYVHHDLMLPSFPLCLEWMNFAPNKPELSNSFGNYIAVGTFEPEIEIWSLDVIDGLYPDAILGKVDKGKSAKEFAMPVGTGKKKKKQLKVNDEHHVDAVLSLSWNKSHRNILASGSADHTVKLWDLNTSKSVRSFNPHNEKVQSVEWNEKESTILLTGGFDQSVRTFDTRSPNDGVGCNVSSDVEVCKWDPWNAHNFYVSTENGIVQQYDARNLSSIPQGEKINNSSNAIFTLSAHDGAVSALDINPHFKGCLATGGTDKSVKIWNVDQSNDLTNVSLTTSRDLGVGSVFSVNFSPDDPLVLAAAGSKAKMQVWDIGTNPGARSAFAGRINDFKPRERSNEGIIGVEDDNEDENE